MRLSFSLSYSVSAGPRGALGRFARVFGQRGARVGFNFARKCVRGQDCSHACLPRVLDRPPNKHVRQQLRDCCRPL